MPSSVAHILSSSPMIAPIRRDLELAHIMCHLRDDREEPLNQAERRFRATQILDQPEAISAQIHQLRRCSGPGASAVAAGTIGALQAPASRSTRHYWNSQTRATLPGKRGVQCHEHFARHRRDWVPVLRRSSAPSPVVAPGPNDLPLDRAPPRPKRRWPSALRPRALPEGASGGV